MLEQPHQDGALAQVAVRDGVTGEDLAAISNAMVGLHKEQFGRGPTRARTHFGGPDVVTCILQDTMTPAERKLTSLGEALRVIEMRAYMQSATIEQFKQAVAAIVGRPVIGFMSAIDPDNDVVAEVFILAPAASTAEASADT